MKKLIMIMALVLGGVITAQAQQKTLSTDSKTVQRLDKSKIDKKVQTEEEARQAELKYAQQADAAQATTATKKDNYKELSVSSLPASVTQAVAKKYNGATISKASLDSEKGVYKVVISQGTAGLQTVYLNQSDL